MSTRSLIPIPILALIALFGANGCSALLDFDDVSGLPCPCDTDHVCLIASDRCVRRGSVDLFKSCDTNTSPPGGNDLCPENSRCIAINGNGPRCLPTCQPTHYSTPEAGLLVASQCPNLTTCWETEGGGGVCSEGVCSDIPNTCPGGEKCVRFNGAGVCFKECDIFSMRDCGPDLTCHPIGSSNITACIRAGTLERNTRCSDAERCKSRGDEGRPLICTKPVTESRQDRYCLAVCAGNQDCGPPINTICVVAIPNFNSFAGELKVCAAN